MKAETKAKIRVKLNRAWEAVKPWIIPATVITTVCAAWDGYSQSHRNERELRELQKYAAAIDHGGGNALHEIDERIKALEEKQNELLEKAIDVTEGKEEVA